MTKPQIIILALGIIIGVLYINWRTEKEIINAQAQLAYETCVMEQTGKTVFQWEAEQGYKFECEKVYFKNCTKLENGREACFGDIKFITNQE